MPMIQWTTATLQTSSIASCPEGTPNKNVQSSILFTNISEEQTKEEEKMATNLQARSVFPSPNVPPPPPSSASLQTQ